ncbi:MAG: DUF342 domain-containing protein [Chitinispirillaceae bacterium]|nr:DUF342 domain-containing protein [Chitinispirillaceae bacterium]
MQIALDDARPGMVLSADVNIPGGTLLNKDQTLDETLIELMRGCDIATISVAEGTSCQGSLSTAEGTPQDTPESDADGSEADRTKSSAATPRSHEVPAAARIVADGQARHRDGMGRNDHPQAPINPAPPAITVIVTPDAMSARLIVEPVGNSPQELSPVALMEALSAHGVVFGIDTALVDKLVEQWKQSRRRYEIGVIASGVPARPAKEGPVRMTLRHLTSRSECDEVKASHYFWEAAVTQPRIDRAVCGQVIGEKQIGHLSIPGKNVNGVPVIIEEVVTAEVALEDGVAFSPDQQKIIAQVDGIAYQIDSAIGIIPIDFNGTFELEITPDNMAVLCTVHPPGPGGCLRGKEELLRLLSEKGVCSGILETDIDTMLALCGRGAYPSEPFTIARGIPPVNGNNGKLQYCFNTKTSLSPSINSEGHADYKSINIVNSIKGQQELVVLVPPTPGSDGSDVLGHTLPAEPGNAAKLPQGPHTVIDRENPGLLRAEVDGIVRLSGGVVEVCEGFVVPGDVDFSTGNINYNKSVVVNGDVKAGFKVHCGGDLQVNGTIEDCRITVGGNVLCKYGFVGQSKGVIDAKGDVNLGFMKNQTVRCFKNITIAKEALNCTLLSRDTIFVHGTPLSIVGGMVKARTSITAYAAGNHTGIRTLLEAGIDYLMEEELAAVDEQYKSAGTHYRSLVESFNRFRQTVAGRKHFSSIEQKKVNDFAAALKQAKQQLDVLEERKSIIAGKIHPLADACIKIEHAAYPGTLFKFGERHFFLKEELAGPKNIRYIDHEIRVL